MKFFFDLLPVILFFVAFKWSEKDPTAAASLLEQLTSLSVSTTAAPILISTLVVMIATIAQVAIVWWRHKHVDKMLWFSLALVVGLGAMTLIFQDESFIKWKPTLLYWGLAFTIAIMALGFKKNALQAALGEQLELPSAVWHRVNLAWMLFFSAMGGLNLYIAFHFPTDMWVNFKLFGSMGLLFAFVIAQGFYLSRFIEEK